MRLVSERRAGGGRVWDPSISRSDLAALPDVLSLTDRGSMLIQGIPYRG